MTAAGFVLADTGDDQAPVSVSLIHGHPDGHIFSHPEFELADGTTAGKDLYAGWNWECKTKGNWPAKSFAKQGPNPYELAQHRIYCAAKDCRGTLFTIFNMDSKELTHYAVSASVLGVAKLTNKAAEIERTDLCDTAKAPVAKWECNYCDFCHDCGGV